VRQGIRRAFAGAVVTIALATGCFSRTPKPTFFALSSGSGAAAGAPIASLPDLGIVVGPLEFPRYLDRPEIVSRDGANQLIVADSHRWGGSLRSDILRVVADDLGRLLGTARVAVYPADARFPLKYRVLIDLREFEAVAADRVALRAVWTIAAAGDGRAIDVEEAHIDQPTASTAMSDVVAAQNAALGSMSRAIAERLVQLR
jgi:uncharacterized lipoprotein YmbA